MSNLTEWGKRVAIVVGVFTIISLVSSAWLWLNFPLPASAMSVETLDKGQAKIGRKVYQNDVEKFEYLIKKSKRDKRKWSKMEPDNHQVQDDLDDDIDLLKKKLRAAQEEEKKYKDRLIELGE